MFLYAAVACRTFARNGESPGAWACATAIGRESKASARPNDVLYACLNMARFSSGWLGGERTLPLAQSAEAGAGVLEENLGVA
jgi:hypothetical protein